MRTLGKITAAFRRCRRDWYHWRDPGLGIRGLRRPSPSSLLQLLRIREWLPTGLDGAGAASVSPIGMVHGTSMEGGRATGDVKQYAEAASAAFFLLLLSAPNPPQPRASQRTHSDF